MMDLRLYILQRGSALVMVPLVLGHLAMMIYAIQGGLTAEEILSRTRGSVFWALFYGTFVACVGVHGAIGLRTILFEWAGLTGRMLNGVALLFCGSILVLGLRAVVAVVA